MIISLGWATISLHMHLADRLDPALSLSNQVVEGWIEGLPEVHDDFTRFRFRPAANQAAGRLPRSLLTYWYREPPALLTGEFWRLEMQLKPPWGRVNFQGADREQWLFSEAIGGLATVHSGKRLRPGQDGLVNWNAIREAVRQRLVRSIANEDNRAIVAALAIADRSKLTTQQRDTLRRTGTTHLLAISGLHIGLAALCGLWFARLLFLAVPLRWSMGLAWPATLLLSLLLALLYAGLAGFGTSTIRAVLMLAVGVSALLARRAIHPGQAILTALALILMFDPLTVLSAGFWLSFSAVGVLLLLSSHRIRENRGRLRQMLQTQAGIMLVLLPMSAWWFQSASLCGLIANLWAIPFVTVILVPLIFLGLIFMPVSGVVSLLAFSAAGASAGFLLEILGWFGKVPFASLTLSQPTLLILLLATLGALLLLLPRGVRHRWLGMLLLLPLFGQDQPPDEGQVRLDVLDVGQGTAVLVNSRRHLLLYDSGPGNGRDFDLVDSIIRPAVRRSGHGSPDRIVISHADLDHAGGLRNLRQRYPAAAVYGSFPGMRPGIGRCDDSLEWKWDGISFQVLHPSPWLPYLGNDSSCVVGVSMGQISLLLPGDIALAAEQRLSRRQLAKTDILLVPHHGSGSSSSTEFLRAIRPKFAIATAGLGNRFGFPRPEVVQRYRNAGIPFWSTDACGALRLLLSAGGNIEASSARRSRPAPWRWPAGEACP